MNTETRVPQMMNFVHKQITMSLQHHDLKKREQSQF